MQARMNGRGSGAFGQFFSEGLVRKTLEKSSKMFYLFQSKHTHPPQTHTHTLTVLATILSLIRDNISIGLLQKSTPFS